MYSVARCVERLFEWGHFSLGKYQNDHGMFSSDCCMDEEISTLNFINDHDAWAYEWLLGTNSSKRKGITNVTIGNIVFLMILFCGWPWYHSNNKWWLFTRDFLKPIIDLTFPFVYTLLYIATCCCFDKNSSNFYGLFLLPRKCIL